MRGEKIFVSLLAMTMVVLTLGAANVIGAPGPAPASTNTTWTEKFFYEVGETVDIYVELPDGACHWNGPI